MADDEIREILDETINKISFMEREIKEMRVELRSLREEVDKISVDIHFLSTGQDTLQSTADRIERHQRSWFSDPDDA